MGMIQLNPNDVPSSMDGLNRWLRDGPMHASTSPAADRRRSPALTRILIGSSNGFMNWAASSCSTLGSRPAANRDRESRPPQNSHTCGPSSEQTFLCAHAGGEWEQAFEPSAYTEHPYRTPASRPQRFIEMAVRRTRSRSHHLRSHLPSRSLGTELSKVIAANVSEEDKRRILGANFRRILQ